VAEEYRRTKLVAIAIGLGCLGWMEIFQILMPHRPRGAWVFNGKALLEAGFFTDLPAVLLA